MRDGRGPSNQTCSPGPLDVSRLQTRVTGAGGRCAARSRCARPCVRRAAASSSWREGSGSTRSPPTCASRRPELRPISPNCRRRADQRRGRSRRGRHPSVLAEARDGARHRHPVSGGRARRRADGHAGRAGHRDRGRRRVARARRRRPVSRCPPWILLERDEAGTPAAHALAPPARAGAGHGPTGPQRGGVPSPSRGWPSTTAGSASSIARSRRPSPWTFSPPRCGWTASRRGRPSRRGWS